MMKYFPAAFLLIIILFGENSIAQFNPSISNYLRYGKGERSLGTFKGDFEYFENLTDFRLGLPNNITVGTRLLIDSPPEVGIPFQGIKRRFIEYRGEKFFLRAGNFSELFGRGTAFNLFESRGLGFDTWMDGVQAKYKDKYFSISLVGGSLDFKDSVEFVRNEFYNLKGGNVEVTPLSFLSAGISYIHAAGDIKLEPINQNIKASIPSFYFNINYDQLSFLFDYSHKKTQQVELNKSSSGYGIYSSISYFYENIGFTLDYKNYLFDERDPFEQNDFTRPTRMLPFQNPPIVMKEHSYTLLTRAIHQIDFNDEVGLQLEIFYSPSDKTSLNFNASIASRHDNYKINQQNFSFAKIARKNNFLPTFDSKLSPYYEVFGEIEHYYSSSISAKAAFAIRSKTFYDEYFDGKNNHEITSYIVPIQFKHSVNDYFSYELEYQAEKVSDNFNSQRNYYNQLFTIISSFYSTLTMALRYEITDNAFEISGNKNWAAIELGYRLSQTNTVTLSYGKERGGQICSNGVCRYIQPFEGFRFSLISNI